MAEERDELEGVELPDKMFFRIGEVAGLVGVEPHVLRYWENEFRMRPSRSASGQRMYRQKDIARFLRIRRLLHQEGFTIAGARKALSGKDKPKGEAAIDAAQLQPILDTVRGVRRRVAEARERLASAPGLPVDDGQARR